VGCLGIHNISFLSPRIPSQILLMNIAHNANYCYYYKKNIPTIFNERHYIVEIKKCKEMLLLPYVYKEFGLKPVFAIDKAGLKNVAHYQKKPKKIILLLYQV
jgi:hypothetical protein